MLSSLTIKGFRCFRELRVKPLKRVNLFVGKNGAGKTSVLEAAELATIGSIEGLVRSAVRRREGVSAPAILSPGEENYAEHIVDPSHLFFGHQLKEGARFSLESDGDVPRHVICSVERPSLDSTLLTLRFVTHLTPKKHADRLTISPAGGVLPPPHRRGEPSVPVNFLAAAGIDVVSLNEHWDRVVLTPEEEGITAALRMIDPRVDRLAFLAEGSKFSAPVFVKLSNVEKRLPLVSLGGGMVQLCALALHLFSAGRGFVLVDEIDTGLHYSLMVDMWRMVVETARRLDIQVFATTHSLDCVRALARLRRKYPETAEEVILHRVEENEARTVAYDPDEIVIAAEGHIEVR